jgi:hypothetical protein
MPIEKETLNKVSNGFDITVPRIFRIDTGILNGPVAFPSFNLEISFTISSEVTGEIYKLSHGELVR